MMKKKPSGARAGVKESVGKTPVKTVKSLENEGFSAYAEQEGRCGKDVPPPEIAPAAWMSPALIERARAGWSKYYGRPLERDEAVEILHNIRWFGELLMLGMNGGGGM